MTRRIVLTGAESTGKTTLARALAAHFACPLVLEYGREWSEQRPGGPAAPWQTRDFIDIALEQNRRENARADASPNGWLICDTDALATAIWHERYMGVSAPEVLAVAALQVRPFVRILAGDEIPFEDDGLRDGEHIRHAMQSRFRDVLAETDVPWIEVRGDVAARFIQALAFIAAQGIHDGSA